MTLIRTLIIIDFIFFGFASNAQEKNVYAILKMPDDSVKINELQKVCDKFISDEKYDSALYINQIAFQLSSKIKSNEKIVQCYTDKYKIFYSQEKDSLALKILSDALEKCRELKYTPGFLAVNQLFSNYYAETGEWQSAIKYSSNVLLYCDSIKDATLYAATLSKIGMFNNYTGNSEEGINAFLRGLRIAETARDSFRISVIYNNMAMLYNNIGDAEKSKEYCYKSIAVKKTADSAGLFFPYQNLGYVYNTLSINYDSSLYYYRLAQPLALAAGNKAQSGNIYQNLSAIFDRKGMQDSSMYYAQKAFDTFFALGNKSGIASSLNALGVRYRQMGERTHNKSYFRKSLDYFNRALEYAEQSGGLWKLNTFLNLSDLYAAMGDFKNAYKYELLYSEIKDTLLNEEIVNNTAKLEAKYQTEKKDREIVENKLQLKQQDLELTKKSATNKMLLAGVAILLLLVVFGAITFVQRHELLQKQKEAEKQKAVEQTRAAIAGDLHDDIGATLSSVQIMSSFAVNSIDNSTGDAKQWVQKIGENTGDMLQNIRDIVWTLNPANDNAEELILRMKQFATQILEPKNIQYTFTTDEKIIKYLNELIAKRNVFLILKEVLNNAAKYSNASNVTIELKMQNTGCRMKISDDGKGFDTAATSSGNGLKSLKKRAEQLNGTIEINSLPGTGTTVTLVC